MRTRQPYSDVKLVSLDHKINRKAMILREYDFAYRNEAFQETLNKIEDAFDETIKTPVGDMVRRHINL